LPDQLEETCKEQNIFMLFIRGRERNRERKREEKEKRERETKDKTIVK